MKTKQRWYLRHQLFNHDIEPELLSWLFDSSSLTARLTGYCESRFSVSVISQRRTFLTSEEASAMGLSNVHSALVRQVLLYCGDRPMVYARTVIPTTTIQGAQRRYANMGNRPLGAMLFADRTMKREQVQVALLSEDAPAKQFVDADVPVWGRRSVFRVGGKPLLVSEFFLPGLFKAGS